MVITNAPMRAMKNNKLASDKCARKKKPNMKLTKLILWNISNNTLNIPSKCGQPNENYIVP